MTEANFWCPKHSGAQLLLPQQPWHARAFTPANRRLFSRLEGALTADDLNPLSPKGRFLKHPHFLVSAPLALAGGLNATHAALVSSQDLGFLDSGGFQAISSQDPLPSYEERLRRLRLGGQFQAAAIFDAPTEAVDRWPKSPFRTVSECLEFTIESGRHAIQRRPEGRTVWCNVFQGRTKAEADTWFEAVLHLSDPRRFGSRALTGVCLAGRRKLAFSDQLARIIRLRDLGFLGRRPRLHWLGTGQGEACVICSAIQSALQATVSVDAQVSCDTASAFQLVGKFGPARAYMPPAWERRRLSLRSVAVPDDPRHIGSDVPSGLSSPFGERITLGHLNVRYGSKSALDLTSQVLLAAHNIYVHLEAIARANLYAEMPIGRALAFLPARLLEAREYVFEIFRAEQPMRLIREGAHCLDALAPQDRETPFRDGAGNKDDRWCA